MAQGTRGGVVWRRGRGWGLGDGGGLLFDPGFSCSSGHFQKTTGNLRGWATGWLMAPRPSHVPADSFTSCSFYTGKASSRWARGGWKCRPFEWGRWCIRGAGNLLLFLEKSQGARPWQLGWQSQASRSSFHFVPQSTLQALKMFRTSHFSTYKYGCDFHTLIVTPFYSHPFFGFPPSQRLKFGLRGGRTCRAWSQKESVWQWAEEPDLGAAADSLCGLKARFFDGLPEHTLRTEASREGHCCPCSPRPWPGHFSERMEPWESAVKGTPHTEPGMSQRGHAKTSSPARWRTVSQYLVSQQLLQGDLGASSTFGPPWGGCVVETVYL